VVKAVGDSMIGRVTHPSRLHGVHFSHCKLLSAPLIIAGQIIAGQIIAGQIIAGHEDGQAEMNVSVAH